MFSLSKRSFFEPRLKKEDADTEYCGGTQKFRGSLSRGGGRRSLHIILLQKRQMVPDASKPNRRGNQELRAFMRN